MTRIAIPLAALVVIAAAVPSHVEARNGRVAAGVIGGLAAGAIIGGAIASQPRAYYEPSYDAPARVYVAPSEVCVERREVWSNRYQQYVVQNVRVPC